MSTIEQVLIDRTQELPASKIGLIIVLKRHFGHNLKTWIEVLTYLQTRDLPPIQSQIINELLQDLKGESWRTKDELVKLCHSRIPRMRSIVDYIDSNLIAPLPIWGPVPKKYRRTAQDDFNLWGLEAQDPGYLPWVLQPFVYVVNHHGRGKKYYFIHLREGAYNGHTCDRSIHR